LEVVTVFDFIPEGPNQTRLKIVWTNARVSDEEAKTFANAHGGMTQGWTGSLDKLYAYVLL
jgi:Activator of Hsp90 ATPase homolog 1-like protein